MTIKETLIKNSEKLKSNKNIDNPFREAELLLAFVLKKSCEYLIINEKEKISSKKNLKYQTLIKERLNNKSIALLCKNKSFYGFDFFVNKNVLIPRPETELIIDKALKLENNFETIIDIGTGSGCIIISLAKKINNPKTKFFASDISSKALYVAKKNSNIQKVKEKIKFFQGDLLSPYLKNKSLLSSNILIIANLPYLTKEQIKNSPSIQKEPYLALYASDYGLGYYKKLLKQIEISKFNKNYNLKLIFEIDPKQIENLTKLVKNKYKFQFIKDLSEKSRFLFLNF